MIEDFRQPGDLVQAGGGSGGGGEEQEGRDPDHGGRNTPSEAPSPPPPSRGSSLVPRSASSARRVPDCSAAGRRGGARLRPKPPGDPFEVFRQRQGVRITHGGFFGEELERHGLKAPRHSRGRPLRRGGRL